MDICTGYNSYTKVCPLVGGDNPRALASGLSTVQADKSWYNYFYTTFIKKDETSNA